MAIWKVASGGTGAEAFRAAEAVLGVAVGLALVRAGIAADDLGALAGENS